MRVLLAHPGPEFSVGDVYRGWLSGLQANGVEVASFNLGDRLTFYERAFLPNQTDDGFVKALDHGEAILLAAQGIKAACYDWWPDLVVVVSAFFVPGPIFDVMRDRGHRVVILHTESPYEDDKQLLRASHADLNIVNDPTNLDRFRDIGPAAYIPHGYDPALHHPRPAEPELASDFCFVGTGMPSRIRFFEQVDWSDIDAAFAGYWPIDAESPLWPFLVHEPTLCTTGDETVRLYTSTKMSANLYRKEADAGTADGWSMGPREVELAACGTPFLREPRPEGDALFPFLPTFTEPGDFADRLRWWLARPDLRDEVARKAQEAVADRTFANHAAEMLRLVDKIPGRPVG